MTPDQGGHLDRDGMERDLNTGNEPAVTPTEDSALYDPPAGAEETDRVDAALDGTSASHYGANDPALYEGTDGNDGDDA